jgi:uncharacterized protein
VNPGHEQELRVGIISDTHNYLDPQVPALFEGVAHILHAGDIGQPRLLLELERLAPVTAVAGNTDDPGFHYPMVESVTLAQRKILLHHIVHPHGINEYLATRMEREKPGVVIFGHTHKPFCEQIGGVLFFNPGYAGKPRFGLKRSVAILHCSLGQVRPEFLDLD